MEAMCTVNQLESVDVCTYLGDNREQIRESIFRNYRIGVVYLILSTIRSTVGNRDVGRNVKLKFHDTV